MVKAMNNNMSAKLARGSVVLALAVVALFVGGCQGIQQTLAWDRCRAESHTVEVYETRGAHWDGYAESGSNWHSFPDHHDYDAMNRAETNRNGWFTWRR